MPMFNFKKDFTPQILRGRKVTTIRSMRKRLPKKGEEMQLYTGPRFSPRKLGVATVELVGLISIFWDVIDGDKAIEIDWLIEGQDTPSKTIYKIGSPHLDMFVKEDGFRDWQSFLDFFTTNHREQFDDVGFFSGFIVRWTHFTIDKEYRS